jgi:hypothetical protein
MLFTLFVAVLVATVWTLGSYLLVGSATHDPSTLELAVMGGITLGTYAWMQRLRKIREQQAAFAMSDQLRSTFAAALTAEETAADDPNAVPNRYHEALADLHAEATPADHVA